jgi:hypothetical protein
MEAKVLGIGEFRKQLSARVEAAHWQKEATIVRHGQRQQPRAALVPYDVGPEPVPIGVEGDVHSYAVSREWFERALAALSKTK